LKKVQWDTLFQQLIKYKGTFGDCNVPVPHKIKSELGEFVRTQRVWYKLRKEGMYAWWTLSDDQVDRLEEVGFSWLTAGGVEEGGMDSDVVCGTQCKISQMEILNNLQKEATHLFHSRSTPSPMRSDNIRAEDKAITFHEEEDTEEEQNSSQPMYIVEYRDKWKYMYDQLCAYKARNGHCLVPLNYAPNKSLGIWVLEERQVYKKKEPRLDSYRIQKLNGIGFVWNAREHSWMKMYEELKLFQQTNKNTVVQQKEKTNQLSQWVDHRRREYKAYKDMSRGHDGKRSKILTEEGIRLLERISYGRSL